MPIISMSSSTLNHTHSLRESFDFAARNGFKGFEIDTDPPKNFPGDLCTGVFREIKKSAKKNNMSLSVHCPLASFNIASLNPYLRKESLKKIRKCIDILNFIENEILVLHNGIADFDSKKIKETSFSLNLDSLSECRNYAEKKGVTLAIENTGLNKLDNSKDNLTLKKIITSVKGLRVTFDIGHAFVKNEFKNFLTLFRNDIAHVHLSDNNRKRDGHLPIGSGKINFEPFRNFFKNFKKMIVLEIFYWQTPQMALLKSVENFKGLIK